MTAGIGDNIPPFIAADYSELQARIDTLLGSFERAPQSIESVDIAEMITDLT